MFRFVRIGEYGLDKLLVCATKKIVVMAEKSERQGELCDNGHLKHTFRGELNIVRIVTF